MIYDDDDLKIDNIIKTGSSENHISIFPGSDQQKRWARDMISMYGNQYLTYLIKFHNELSNDVINLNNIDDIIEYIVHVKSDMDKNYLYALLFPEKVCHPRIPTKFPMGSSSMTDKGFFSITPNFSGNFYLQWCPQNLLTVDYAGGINTGDFLLNVNDDLTGSRIDSDPTHYETITSTRLKNSKMVDAYRLVAATFIMTYQGSYQAHSGVLGGGTDISFIDSLQPDFTGSEFSSIDDRTWPVKAPPSVGIRLNYFPYDYSCLNYIKPDKSTNQNGLSTCARLFAYGQNIPAGASIRVDFCRHYEWVPTRPMKDYAASERLKPKNDGTSSEPAVDMGLQLAEERLLNRPLDDEKSVETYGLSGGRVKEPSTVVGNLADIASELGMELKNSVKELGKGIINNWIDEVKPILKPAMAFGGLTPNSFAGVGLGGGKNFKSYLDKF